MRKLILSIAVGAMTLTACNPDPTDIIGNELLDTQLETALNAASPGGLEDFKMPVGNQMNTIPADPLNTITPAKVDLGKLLFHETGLAVNPKHEFSMGTYSCASCHFAEAGFQAGRFQAIADGGIGFGNNGEGRRRGSLYQAEELDVQPLRSPSAMNGAYQKNMLWSGQFGATGVNVGTEEAWTADTPKAVNHLGYEGLEIQAIAGIGVHRMADGIPDELRAAYEPLYDAAFSDVPTSERYNKEHTGLAIAAYERTLLANEAPFQKWLNGDKDAMTDQEKEGATLFFTKAKCVSCHTGPALNTMEFHALGMMDLNDCPEEVFQVTAETSANLGRGDFTGHEADNYKFKVPQLYNMKDSPFFGHGSSFFTIRQVLEYKNNGVAANSRVPESQLATDFTPLNLTETELDALEAFLTNSLYDNNLQRYVPESLPSGNCFPNNDPMSRNDLGCN